jgi:hypothetical protein
VKRQKRLQGRSSKYLLANKRIITQALLFGGSWCNPFGINKGVITFDGRRKSSSFTIGRSYLPT